MLIISSAAPTLWEGYPLTVLKNVYPFALLAKWLCSEEVIVAELTKAGRTELRGESEVARRMAADFCKTLAKTSAAFDIGHRLSGNGAMKQISLRGGT